MRVADKVLGRREFVGILAAGLASSVWQRTPLAQIATRRIKAAAFDAFPIFDPRPISRLAETVFPGRGAELSDVWRTRQFEYQWLRALSGRYADFWQTTEDALVFAAQRLELELTAEKRARLMQAYLALETWPDVPAALGRLKQAGIRLAFLSNMTGTLLEACMHRAGIVGTFEHVLSTDQIRAYKPEPRAYQMAIDAFELEREEILFVPFAGWDAAGAKSFGYPTFWVNRLNQPAEQLGVLPDATGQDLGQVVSFLRPDIA